MILENGLKYETVKVVTQPYQPKIEGQPLIEDEEGNIIQPFIAAQEEKQEVVEDKKTGKLIGIEADIEPSSFISVPHQRKVEFLSAVDEGDLEMILNCRINYYTPDGNKLMLDAIAEDKTLSKDAKAIQSQQFASYTLAPKSTRGSFVNPLTGQLVDKGTDGAISEMFFLQQLTRTQLVLMGIPADERRQQVLRYLVIKMQMLLIIQREGI